MDEQLFIELLTCFAEVLRRTPLRTTYSLRGHLVGRQNGDPQIFFPKSGSTKRNPLCLVMIIPRIRHMVPTMYTAGFEPARGGGGYTFEMKNHSEPGGPKTGSA